MSDVREAPGRGRGDRGTAMAVALILLSAFTAGGLIWLSRDVNRTVSNRSAAQSIAFQAARAGAQQVAVGSLRDSGGTVVEIDELGASAEADRIVRELFDSYGVGGSHEIDVVGDRVTVTVTIEDAVEDVTASGTVEARTGP